ncbi:hypothetical protein V6Z92_005973 [Aspergillus fumigatus]
MTRSFFLIEMQSIIFRRNLKLCLISFHFKWHPRRQDHTFSVTAWFDCLSQKLAHLPLFPFLSLCEDSKFFFHGIVLELLQRERPNEQLFEKLVVPGVYGSYVKATCTNPTGLCQWLLRILTVREGYEHR